MGCGGTEVLGCVLVPGLVLDVDEEGGEVIVIKVVHDGLELLTASTRFSLSTWISDDTWLHLVLVCVEIHV